MARIDSLLSILAAQNANELRVGTDREPKMLAFGAPKRLSIPTTPEDTLRELLGEILTPEREQAMLKGRVEASYDAPGLGPFHVKLGARPGGGFDVVFLRESRGARRPSAAVPAEALSLQPSLTVVEAPPPLREVAAAPPLSANDSPAVEGVTQSLVELVALATSMRASDLHLSDGMPPIIRVDGKLQQLGGAPVDVASTMTLGPGNHARIASGHALDAGLELPTGSRVRAHVFRTAVGLGASIRLLPGGAPPLASLHLVPSLDDLIHLPHGLVLVCGATGSGKSTTIASLAQEALQERSIVLTTLEDPIEYALSAPHTSLVRRRQVGRDVPDFASGLRDALREDPDVLLVGEMRDPETVSLALTAAETGHLVFSSLHSGSTAAAIDRIVDAYPSASREQVRVQLAESLRVVVAQRLLPRARGGGRIAVLEVLRVNHAVGTLIREGRTAQIASVLQSGRKDGMVPLERSLADRVQASEVKLEDARGAANDVTALMSYLGK